MNKVTGRNHLGRRTRSCDHSIQRFTVLAWALPGSCLELCLLCFPVSLGLSVSRAGSPSATPQPFPSSNKSPSIPHFPLLTLQILQTSSSLRTQKQKKGHSEDNRKSLHESLWVMLGWLTCPPGGPSSKFAPHTYTHPRTLGEIWCHQSFTL